MSRRLRRVTASALNILAGRFHPLWFYEQNMVIAIRTLCPIIKKMQFQPAKFINTFDSQDFAGTAAVKRPPILRHGAFNIQGKEHDSHIVSGVKFPRHKISQRRVGGGDRTASHFKKEIQPITE